MDKILKSIPQIDICIIAKEFIGLLISAPARPSNMYNVQKFYIWNYWKIDQSCKKMTNKGELENWVQTCFCQDTKS